MKDEEKNMETRKFNSLEDDSMETKRLSTDEVNKKAKSKKTGTSSETQVIGKINPDEKIKDTKKNKKEKEKKKKFKERHPRIATIFRIILILIILCIIIVAGIIAGAMWGGYDFLELLGDDYKINIDDLVIKYENSSFYDADGNYLGELSSGEKRRIVSLEQMSEYLPKAYIAIEDERFYDHSGVDFKRTAAATATYIFNGGKSSFGGSTITQQVVKNLTGDKEDTATRKVKEMVKALQVEHYLSKSQILELYLNLIFVGGEDVNGVSLGAVYYFNKDVKDLSIAECAYLAGINHSPNAYLPFKQYEDQAKKTEMDNKIKDRTKTVLAKMKELGYITEEQYNASVAEVDAGLAFSNGSTATTVQVSYLTDAAIEQILQQMIEEKGYESKSLAEIQLYSGGYKIYTTQKSGIQEILENELGKDKYGNYVSRSGQEPMASMTIIEPTTGNVVGAAGRGEDGSTTTVLGYFNLTTDMLKQTGSSIKPLAVTCPGLESGKLTASTMFYDYSTTFPVNYTPGEWYNGWKYLVSMRYATAYSCNIPHVKALSTIGLQTGVEFLQKMNFTDVTGNEGLAIALGGFSNGASTLQMAAGYAMIANDGVYIQPTFYLRVEDSSGNIYIQPKSVEERSTRMMSASNAYIMKSMLQSVVEPGGTATYAKIDGIDTAAKTGTTNGDKDRWLCGFTNYYAAACWFGYNNKEEVKPSNYYTAGGIWTAVMKEVHSGLTASNFVFPSDIVTVTVCADSGMTATDKCTETYSEIFVNGTVPGPCDVHGNSYKICNETGLLASEYCQDYSIRYYKELPASEANGNWQCSYPSGGYSDVPTEVCHHTLMSYPIED